MVKKPEGKQTCALERVQGYTEAIKTLDWFTEEKHNASQI